MGTVNLYTHWCLRCNAPTLHRQTPGLSDGEVYAVFTCERCGYRAVGEPTEAEGGGRGVMLQPEGLQPELAKLSRAARQYVLQLGMSSAEQQSEIERLMRENEELRSGDVYAKCQSLIAERDECRKLLREAVDWLGDVRTNDAEVESWIVAARAAGGE